MLINMSTVVKQSKDQLSCHLDEEVAILNMKSALYYGLGEVGSVIWERLASETSVKNVCQVVIAEFDVSEAQCQSDVISFLGKLAEVGLIEVSDADGKFSAISDQ